MFIGYTGFRFPICHYPTIGTKACELHSVSKAVIGQLQDYGFTIDYICQDGTKENRAFIKSNFSDDPKERSFMIKNSSNSDRRICLVQDFSHIIKKIRNGLITSGNRQRTITSIGPIS